MKKILTVLLACVLLTGMAKAQDKAVGVKLNGGIELSGQLNLSGSNRAEANLGYSWGGINLSGYYQWVKPLPELGPKFKWYYGAGGILSLDGDLDLGIAGQIGLEFDLPDLIEDVPLQLTVDLTPGYNLVGGLHPIIGGGLGIRYTF